MQYDDGCLSRVRLRVARHTADPAGTERFVVVRRCIPWSKRIVLTALLIGGGCAPLLPETAGIDSGSEPRPITAGVAAPVGGYDDAVDVLDYDLEVWLPAPGGTRIEARAKLTLAAGPAAEAVLDFTGLAVREVTVDGRAAQARYRDGILRIALEPGGVSGDPTHIEVVYEGTPDDGLILRENVHGRPSAFVDNWPNRARFWFPSVDHPHDKATASLTIHAPASWVVVANGRQLGEPVPGPDETRTWRWRTDVAVSAYNLVFGAAEMTVVPIGLAACGRAPASLRDDGCVEVSAWLFAEDIAQASRSFGRAADMVDFYTELIGPYPFEKLAHVQSATRFGGMENASAIFYSERRLASSSTMEGVVAHETAHQWFGNAVTARDWTELWLSEGFATYFGHLYFERRDGIDDFRRRLEESRRNYLESAVTGSPIVARYDDLFEQLNPNNYLKGGWVLHMLRGVMGDETFFVGIRDYYASHAGTAVTSGDFATNMAGAAGDDLGWFFAQWLHEPGYPVLEVEHGWDAAVGEIAVTVRQVQDPSWPTFRLPLELEIVDGGGEARRHQIELTERGHTFRFAASGPAGSVRVDPDGWVLKRMAGKEIG